MLLFREQQLDMARILGLDYGEKTIGVAVSDPLLITASGVETIHRKDEKSIKKSIARLSEIIKEYEISTIVLGFPKNMNNTLGDRCEKTLEFKSRLERNFKRVPVILWDERLSTVSANYSLVDLDFKKRKEVIDKVVAVYILQGYLEQFNK